MFLLHVIVRIKKNTLFCPILFFLIFMNSSAISILQRKMLNVSMASGEAEGKRSTASGVCFENPFEIHICSAVVLLMSAAEYIWVYIHTKHTPGHVWPQSRCLCLSSTLLLRRPPWGQKSPVKTNCPARETFWRWGRGVDHDEHGR